MMSKKVRAYCTNFRKMLYLCGVHLRCMCTYIAGKKRHWKSIGYLKPPKFEPHDTDNQCPCI